MGKDPHVSIRTAGHHHLEHCSALKQWQLHIAQHLRLNVGSTRFTRLTQDLHVLMHEWLHAGLGECRKE